MVGKDVTTVDLTRPEATVRVTGRRGRSAGAPVELTLPWAVAFRLQGSAVRGFAGDDLSNLLEDSETILFDRLHEDLPRIQPKSAKRIVSTFWEAVRSKLRQRGLLDLDGKLKVHVIVPYQYPQTLLESVREGCAGAEPAVLLQGFINEALALVMGFVRSPYFTSDTSGMTSARICLMTIEAGDLCNVVCFDYFKEQPARHFIRIQDFFKATCAELPARLKSTTWLDSTHGMFCLTPRELAEEHRKELEQTLNSATRPMVIRHSVNNAHELTLAGGTHLAACCLGQGESGDDFVISTAIDIGVQVNQSSMYALVRREGLAGERAYPHERVETFKLSRLSENDLEVNLYSGFSESLTDCVQLSSARIPVKDLSLSQKRSSAELTIAVSLDSPGHGTFGINRALDGQILAKGEFTLPGLIG